MTISKLITLVLISFPFLVSAQTKQISFFGITHHGIPAIEPKNNTNLKNKLDPSGVWAYNPQFNFTAYEKENLTNISFVVDCYANAAINLAKGKRFQYNDFFYYGYVYGLYFRKNPSRKDNPEFNISENYQLFPNVALNLQYKLSKNVTLRLTSNYVINFIDVAFEF